MQAEHNLDEHAKWKQIQENTFTRWANEHLKTVGSSIDSLETDLSDGLRLIQLVEVLSQKELPSHCQNPKFRSQKMDNVSIALTFLMNEGIKIVNIDSTDIVDGRLKLILGLVWTLILHYSISMPVWEGDEEKPPAEVTLTPKQRLLGWIQFKIPFMSITNFTRDWTTGKPIGALVDACAPGLCPDWDLWHPENSVQNATEAMELADVWLGVHQLIKPEELVDPNVDEQSVMTYLAQYPNCKLKDGAPLRPKTDPNSIPITPVPEPVNVPAEAYPGTESYPAKVYPEVESTPAEVDPGYEIVPAEVHPGDVIVPAEVHPGDAIFPTEVHDEILPAESYPGPRPNGLMDFEPAIVLIDAYERTDPIHRTAIGQLYDLYGHSYLITGRALPDAYRFVINFVLENNDVALHINPRFDEKCVVRNNQVRGSWVREERESTLPFLFRRGEYFAIQVLVTQSCYLMSFNGHHMEPFVHRMPYDKVRYLEVLGCADDIRIHRSEVRSYPKQFIDVMPQPYIPLDVHPIDYNNDIEVEPLNEGDSFLFSGEIDPKCEVFEIVFIYPNAAYRDFPFHLKSIFKKNQFLMNSKINNEWCRNAVTNRNPFRKGERFTIQVLITVDFYLIAINGQHFTKFAHRIPFQGGNLLRVQGGIHDVKMHRTRVMDYPQSTLQRQIL
ncbi:hypothetical protein AWZ03_005328 [Drosophila navojoa]|uniref:Galectin n=1 Tax=Drosophila navojoa TaxID=7232 RepID=A0A484BH88_DRONA|nr:uncharacterized protein LOC108659001 [Drosophila navojoa]TDG48153.1 hypothetical protein AWZ03_005328 [Drosophila navojoa]